MIKKIPIVLVIVFNILQVSAQVKEVTIKKEWEFDKMTPLYVRFSPNSKYILCRNEGGRETCSQLDLGNGFMAVPRFGQGAKFWSSRVAEYDHSGEFIVCAGVNVLEYVPDNPPTAEITAVWKLGDWDGNRYIMTENLKDTKHILAKFNKPGNLVLLIRDDQKGRYARLWDWNGNNVQNISTTGQILYADFNYVGDKVILVKSKNNTYLELWNSYKFTKDKILKVSKPSGYFTYAVSRCMANTIFAGTDKGEIIVWDSGVENELAVKSEHSAAIVKIVFDKTCERFATISNDNTAKVWGAGTLEVYTILTGHTAALTDVQFSPNGYYVVTGSKDSTACIWDSRTGERLALLGKYKGSVNTTQFSVTGDTVLVSDDYGEAHMYVVSGLHPSVVRSDLYESTDNVLNVTFDDNNLRLQFEKPVEKPIKYSIVNYLGEEVLHGNVVSGNTLYEIPIHSLQMGWYILISEVNGKSVQEKFVIIN